MKKQAINYNRLALVTVATAQSPLQAQEDLMVFDARCLDRETWRELLRVLPDLTRIHKAWRAHFSEHGFVSCHPKKTEYGSGGFCYRCLRRISTRMRTCFRKINAGRDIPDEVASISRRYDAAQRLLNGEV